MNKAEELQLYRDVTKDNGERYQLVLLVEELTELAQAITKILRGGTDTMHVAEEMADVLIVLGCIGDHLQLHGAVRLYKNHKLERLRYKYLNGLPT